MYSLPYTLSLNAKYIQCTIQSFLSFFFFLGNVVLENLKVKENALVSLYWTMLTKFTKFNYMLDIILM